MTRPRRIRIPTLCLLASAAILAPACSRPSPVTRPHPRTLDAAPARPSPVIQAKAWSFEGIPGQQITTPSFRIHTTLNDSLLLDRLPVFVEHALLHDRTAIIDLPAPAERLDAFVMADRAEWTRVTQRLMGDDAAIYLRIAKGGFAARAVGVYYDIGPHDTLALAAHEGWHQFTQATFQDPLPIWLEEGLACWMEGFGWDPTDNRRPVFAPWANLERYDALRRAAAENDIRPLAELLAARPQDEINAGNARALRYYAQVWAFTQFLYEGDAGAHREVLQHILTDAAAGNLYTTVYHAFGEREARHARLTRTGPQALLAYLDATNFNDLDAAYREFVRRITRPGARTLVEHGHSPAT